MEKLNGARFEILVPMSGSLISPRLAPGIHLDGVTLHDIFIQKNIYIRSLSSLIEDVYIFQDDNQFAEDITTAIKNDNQFEDDVPTAIQNVDQFERDTAIAIENSLHFELTPLEDFQSDFVSPTSLSGILKEFKSKIIETEVSYIEKKYLIVALEPFEENHFLVSTVFLLNLVT